MHISDLVTSPDAFRPGYLNLITAGCGTGKSYFAANDLLSLFPDVQPREILFLTSRALTAEQQAVQYGTVKLLTTECLRDYARFANGYADYAVENKIHIMTFDKLGLIVDNYKNIYHPALSRIKIIILDECHALLSDRHFISFLPSVLTALHGIVHYTNKIVIGMTATPEILANEGSRIGMQIHHVLPEPVYAYKAKQLYVAHNGSLDYFLDKKRFPGRTIVLCRTACEAAKLTSQYKNSALLVSQANSVYCAETMLPLRGYIAHCESLPKYFEVSMGDTRVRRKIDILFTTTTMREGVNLKEESGVRNVICMIPDKLHVIQFVGRCRYNIDTLAVLDTDSYNAKEPSQYIANEHLAFRQFLLGNDDAWFGGMENIVRGTAKDVRRIDASGDTEDFDALVRNNYTNRQLKVPDKQALVLAAKQSGMFVRYNLAPTFKNIVEILATYMGYEVRKKRVAGTGDRYWWIAGGDR